MEKYYNSQRKKSSNTFAKNLHNLPPGGRYADNYSLCLSQSSNGDLLNLRYCYLQGISPIAKTAIAIPIFYENNNRDLDCHLKKIGDLDRDLGMTIGNLFGDLFTICINLSDYHKKDSLTFLETAKSPKYSHKSVIILKNWQHWRSLKRSWFLLSRSQNFAIVCDLLTKW